MKIKTMPLCLALAFGAALVPAKAPPKPADFSGKWVLDTSQTKNLPQGLESYSMVVKQDAQQLTVKSSLKGDLKPMGDLNGPNPGGQQGAGYPGGPIHGSGGIGMGRMGRMGGMGMPGGGEAPMGEGMPGGGLPAGGVGGRGGNRGSRGQGKSHGTIAAFVSYPRRAAYKLDGSETSAQLGGPMHTSATLKANWAKNNQVLKMSVDANAYSGMGSDMLLKDQWKLSKDGESLMVDRSVRSRGGSGTLHLVFHKQTSAASGSAS